MRSYQMTGTNGGRITVVVHHSGRRVVYGLNAGADQASAVELSDHQARKLGAILGGAFFKPAVVEEVEAVFEDLLIDWVALEPNSPGVDKSIAELEIRRTWAERIARSAGWTGAALLRHSGRAVRFVNVDAVRQLARSTTPRGGCAVTRVTIVGAGNMGRGIGTRVVAGGHQVEIIDRDPAEAQQLAKDLGGAASGLDPGSRFGGEVVVFAVYYPGIKDAVRQYAGQLAGKVVVDITNPVDTQTWDGWRRHPEPPRPRRSSNSSRKGHRS